MISVLWIMAGIIWFAAAVLYFLSENNVFGYLYLSVGCMNLAIGALYL